MTNHRPAWRDRIRLRLIKIIQAKYSVPTWLFAVSSLVFGVVTCNFAYFDPTNPVGAAFIAALPFSGMVWGPLLTLASLLAMIGMAKRKERLVKNSAFGAFCLWIFGGIAFWLSGALVNIFIYCLPMMFFWAYKYIAAYVREHNQL